MRAHWLRLRATALPTEDPERVAAAMVHLAGVDAMPEADRLAAHHGGETVMLELQITRQREVRDCMDRLLAPARARLLEELDARVDEDGVLYARFDKQAAAVGEVRPGQGDTVQLRLKPQAHPFSRERAVAMLRAWLEKE